MMVFRTLLALSLALASAADSAPDEDPLRLLIDEFAAAKKSMEPFQPLLNRAMGKSQVEIGPASTREREVASLKLQKQAASVKFAATQQDNSTSATPGQDMLQPGVQQVLVTSGLSTQERRRLWTLLAFPSGPEMVVLSRLSSPKFLGPTLEGWCSGASSALACKHENNLHQYCQLVRRVAPYLAGPNALVSAARGLVEDEAATTMHASRLLDPKDSALMEDITGTPAFKKKLASTCEGLEQSHPGCQEVAKEVLYCQVIGKASLKLVTPEVLVTRMHQTFMKTPELHQALATS